MRSTRPILIPDAESLDVTFALLEDEGLALGLSSGVNVAGAIRLAQEARPGQDHRHHVVRPGDPLSVAGLFNPEFLRSKGLEPPAWLENPQIVDPDFVSVPVTV